MSDIRNTHYERMREVWKKSLGEITQELETLKALVRKEGQAYDLFMALIRSEGASQRLKDWQELRDRLDEAVK